MMGQIQLDKRYIIVTLLTTVGLLVVGWLVTSYLFSLVFKVLEHRFVATSPEIATSFILFVLLFGLCAPVAAILLWSYSRWRSISFSFVGFLICLIISLSSAGLGVLARLLALRSEIAMVKSLPGSPVLFPLGSLKIAEWGIGSLVLICGIGTLVFLLLGSGRNAEVSRDSIGG
jgi:hypothetical protein